jgi:nicotinate-nucleotide adenylyltransferase
MHITLFGGTFDPPHLGHSLIARTLLTQKKADEVWFLPVGEHAFEKKCSPATQRVAMLECILEEQQRIELYEVEQRGMSITYETLQALSKKYPDHEFSFVIGSDNLAQFHRWQQYQQMLRQFHFFVYPRADFPLVPLYPNMEGIAGVSPIAISSTQVRTSARAGESLANLVKPSIAAYIAKQRLYLP